MIINFYIDWSQGIKWKGLVFGRSRVSEHPYKCLEDSRKKENTNCKILCISLDDTCISFLATIFWNVFIKRYHHLPLGQVTCYFSLFILNGTLQYVCFQALEYLSDTYAYHVQLCSIVHFIMYKLYLGPSCKTQRAFIWRLTFDSE